MVAPTEIAPEDWRQFALRLAGRIFDLEIASISLQRQVDELRTAQPEPEEPEES